MLNHKLKQYLMIKAIKTGDLNKILTTATFLEYHKVLRILNHMKFDKINSNNLNKLNQCIIRGESQNETV